MAAVNKAILVGNLGKDPDFRYIPGGEAMAVCNFSIATTEKWTDKSGQKQERTQWHRIKVFGKQAEHCRDYLSKGRQVYVEGRIETRSYEDREQVKRSITEIVATQVLFLGSGNGERRQSEAHPDREGDAGGGLEDDDIPF